MERFPYRHGTSNDVWWRMVDFVPTLIVSYRHGTSDDVWWRMADFVPTLIAFPTDMERLTTYLTAYGGLSFSAHQIIC